MSIYVKNFTIIVLKFTKMFYTKTLFFVVVVVVVVVLKPKLREHRTYTAKKNQKSNRDNKIRARSIRLIK